MAKWSPREVKEQERYDKFQCGCCCSINEQYNCGNNNSTLQMFLRFGQSFDIIITIYSNNTIHCTMV